MSHGKSPDLFRGQFQVTRVQLGEFDVINDNLSCLKQYKIENKSKFKRRRIF